VGQFYKIKLKPLEKLILSSMYVSSLSDRDPTDIIKEKVGVTDEIIDSKIQECISNHLINEDKKTLTETGRSSLKVVLAGGVFDIIHPGHIHTLNAAKSLGDVLIVVIATDKTAEKMKKRLPLHNQNQRKLLVDSLSMVNLSVVGHEGDIFKTVDLIRPEIIALGYDQIHQEKFITEGCKKINLDVTVARLQSPIPEVSSSVIEKKYGEDIHGI
jgi:glycerol-3-phosphate cytidylyltransferase/FAD synthetase